MIQFPTIDPIAIQLGPLAVRWYGLSYIMGFALAWMLLSWRAGRDRWAAHWTKDQVGDLVVYTAFGAVLGGRLGYILLYKLQEYLADPISIFKVWEGGMAFHGGLIGVLIALWLFARKNQKSFFEVSDFMAPAVPVGLFFGRIANFINQELWGSPTEMPWGVVFTHPAAGGIARHPSQLYEAALEGILLFLILWIFSSKSRPLSAISGLFLLGYGVFRFFVEFFRLPDDHVGYIAFEWLTLGQLYSAPMIVIGAIMIIFAYRRRS